jgi:hypothetical protein
VSELVTIWTSIIAMTRPVTIAKTPIQSRSCGAGTGSLASCEDGAADDHRNFLSRPPIETSHPRGAASLGATRKTALHATIDTTLSAIRTSSPRIRLLAHLRQPVAQERITASHPATASRPEHVDDRFGARKRFLPPTLDAR